MKVHRRISNWSFKRKEKNLVKLREWLLFYVLNVTTLQYIHRKVSKCTGHLYGVINEALEKLFCPKNVCIF